MIKRILSVLAAALMLTAAASAETGYATITLNDKETGIGTVYMAESLLTTDAINPQTSAPYTQEEIDAVKAGDSIELDEGMQLALTVYKSKSKTIYQFGVEDTATILSHEDSLMLDKKTGEITTLDGEYIIYRNTGYPVIVLNKEEYGIGTVYFAKDRINTETINPQTGANFTEEEVAAILAGDSIPMPAAAEIGLSVYGDDDDLFFFDEKDAKAMVKHEDALHLDIETGEVTTEKGKTIVRVK